MVEFTRRSVMGAAASLGALTLGMPARADNEEAIAEGVAAAVSRAVRDADFSGAVMLKRGDHVIYQAAVGLADRGHQTPNRIDSRFNLASIGKMFTATVILRLAAQGRLDLDAPFFRYLPDYPSRDIAQRVTSRSLLSHSSGFGNYWDALAERPPSSLVSTTDFLALFKDEPLAFTPGERFGYSNSGYVVLGLIIEAITGESYADHVERTIFAPLNMRKSGFWPLDQVVPDRADGYTRDEAVPGAWRSNVFVNQYRGNPAGGGYATVGDLTTFAAALRDDALMPPSLRSEATTGLFDLGRSRYGLGFMEERVNGHRIVGHSGGHMGIAGEVWLYEDLGWSFAMLTNGEVDGYWSVSAAVKDLLCGESPSTEAYRLGMAMVAAASGPGVDAARALFLARPPGLEPRSVFDVEAAKARHRGRPEAAERIQAIGAFVESAA